LAYKLQTKKGGEKERERERKEKEIKGEGRGRRLLVLCD
jgi:hypothetical protein